MLLSLGRPLPAMSYSAASSWGTDYKELKVFVGPECIFHHVLSGTKGCS